MHKPWVKYSVKILVVRLSKGYNCMNQKIEALSSIPL